MKNAKTQLIKDQQMLHRILKDVRYAIRGFAARPVSILVIVLTLALGVGGNAAIFSLIHQVLLRPLPVPEPNQFVNLGAPGPKPGSTTCNVAGDCDQVFSYPMFRDLEQRQTTFTGIAAHRAFEANIAYQNQAFRGEGAFVSGSYFQVLALVPALGRLIGPQDDFQLGEGRVAVLSYDYWQSNFGGDQAIINKILNVNGQSLTIIGVAPEGFTGTTLGSKPQVFVPLTMRWVLSPGIESDHDNRRSYPSVA